MQRAAFGRPLIGKPFGKGQRNTEMIWAFLTGSIVLGVLSLAFFVLVVVAFWKFGWKIGLIEIFLILVATNIGLSIFRSVNRRIEGS
jgi:ABC-type bacteriocin/lantibiotic exporter with double-glycine peptidase domain